MRSMSVGCASVLLALGTRPALAEPSPETERVKLTWHDASSKPCLDPRGLAERVERELGRRIFVRADEPPASIELTVEVSEQGADDLELQLELLQNGERLGGRTLRGSSVHCDALVESSIVVIALL